MIVRTGFAFRHAVGKPREVVDRLKAVGATTLAIADTCSTYGYVKLTRAAEAASLRPVYGVELLMAEALGEKKQGQDRWVFLARDHLRPVHDLIDQATRNLGREAFLLYSHALRAEGVITIMGPAARLDMVKTIRPDLYLGLSPATPKGLVKEALEREIPLLAMSCNRYPAPEDQEFYRVALGRDASIQTYPQHILADHEWIEHLSWVPRDTLGQALLNRDAVLDGCRATLNKATLLVPPKPKSLRELCRDGAEALGVDLADPVYGVRLDRELALIEEKAYEDYFHIVADIMRFARNHLVVGPGRGSSSGSLVCYLLGITGIDPIRFNLVFERFIDVTRADLPDIDLDFVDKRRWRVFDHVAQVYGRQQSARLGSVTQYKTKSTLRRLGTALRLPTSRLNELANAVEKRAVGDERAAFAIADTLTETDAGRRFLKDYPEAAIAGRLEWHPVNAGQHAAGIVLTQGDIRDYVAVDNRIGGDPIDDPEANLLSLKRQTGLPIQLQPGAMCDKEDAEALNLLKIDALGLSQLSVFERCLSVIGTPKEAYNKRLRDIPLDDPAAFAVMNGRKASGLFQFVPGSATLGLVDKLVRAGGRVETIEDIIALTTLVRPGPLHSGQADRWIRRRAGHEGVTYGHPSLEPHLRDTLGLILYQEQILSIGRDLGGLSWAEVTALRKIMSKTLGGEAFDRFGRQWKEGAVRITGMRPETADQIWTEMCNFGQYGFNRSHAASYAVITYWCLWLKAHHPLAFAAATLDMQKDPDRQIATLRELRDEGVGYLAFDRNLSTRHWEIDTSVTPNRLIGPLTNVVGIGPRNLLDIEDARRHGIDVSKAIGRILDSARTKIDTLEPIKAARIHHGWGLHPDGEYTAIADLESKISDYTSGAVRVPALVTRITIVDENAPDRVKKRGRTVPDHQARSLNLWVRDDTGEVFCKIDGNIFRQIGSEFLAKAKANKSLFVFTGFPKGRDFILIDVDTFDYIGEIDVPLATDGTGSDEPARAGALPKRASSAFLEKAITG